MTSRFHKLIYGIIDNEKGTLGVSEVYDKNTLPKKPEYPSIQISFRELGEDSRDRAVIQLDLDVFTNEEKSKKVNREITEKLRMRFHKEFISGENLSVYLFHTGGLDIGQFIDTDGLKQRQITFTCNVRELSCND